MSLFNAICQAVEAGRSVEVLTLVEVPLGEDGLGEMMLLHDDGRREGCLGGLDLKNCILKLIEGQEWKGPQVLELEHQGGSYRVFWNRVGEERCQAVILGGGHISQPLAQILRLLEYEVTIVDDRAEFADFTRFPAGCRVLCREFDEVWPELRITPQTALIIVTRGHRHDLTCLSQALESNAGYIGMIGSRRKVAAVFTALMQAGVNSEKLAAVHSPIGLDIGAETPAEIAVSIVAEVVAAFKGADARPMAGKGGRSDGAVVMQEAL